MMDSCNRTDSLDGIAEVLGKVKRKGVRLWSHNGALHYRAPRGVLTVEEIDQLQRYRQPIVALLEGPALSANALPKLVPRTPRDRAPLTFSQEARWRHHELGRRPGLRQIACAMRLRGALDLQTLRDSVEHVSRRHEALRTRIAALDDTCVQLIAEPGSCELCVEDLTHLDERAGEAAVARLIDEVILEPIRVDVGPLFAIRLARLSRDEHVMVAAMEHIISDGVSLNIFVRDLLTTYLQASLGRPLVLPALPIQFADYAHWQRAAHASWLDRHLPYWTRRLEGCRRLRFPQAGVTPHACGWGTVPIRIGRSLKGELRTWCRARQTTLVMSVFTAYVALVLRWCDVGETVIRYQSDGRAVPEVQNAVGFFAAILNLRLQLFETDSFVDLMQRTMQEYCNAYEHADSSYLDARSPQPEIVGNPAFNWVPHEPRSALQEAERPQGALDVSPVAFPHPVLKVYELDAEPSILLYDVDDGIEGGIHFPLNRFSMQEMERFACNFFVFLKELIVDSRQRVRDIALR